MCSEPIGATFQRARTNVARRINVAHAALQPWLPREVQIAQLLRLADISGTPELGNVHLRIAASGELVAPTREREISPPRWSWLQRGCRSRSCSHPRGQAAS